MDSNLYFKNNKSFILVELLVVIAIIGLLASVVLVSMGGIRSKAKITKVLEFSQSVQRNLGSYAVGVWSFDEGSGTTAKDGSGYANDGIINGAVYTSDTPHSAAGIGTGKYALSFDGTNDYVNAGNGASLNIGSGQITVEVWIKIIQQPTAVSTYPGIVGNYGATASTGGYLLSLSGTNQNNKTIFFLRQNGTTFDGVSTNSALSTNIWHHVVGLRDSNNIMKLYIDGVQQTQTRTYTGAFSATTNLYIGKYGGDYPNALIDEVRIYEIALTIGEIQQHYTEGLERHKELVVK